MESDATQLCKPLGSLQPLHCQSSQLPVRCSSCYCYSRVLLHLMAMLAYSKLSIPDTTGLLRCPNKVASSTSAPLTITSPSNPKESEGSGMQSPPTSPSPTKRKTAYQIAHPPPSLKQKQRLHIRPKLLLQLHETSLTRRPVPVLDVLPSTVFATRIARKFPKIFRGKNGLGADDLIIARSPEYTDHHDGADISGGESLDSREVVAAICHPRKVVPGHGEMDEIFFNDGSFWQALHMPSGIYQFTLCQSNSNLVARWVPRHSVARRQSLRAQSRGAAALPDDERFTFSLLNPESRRHPVIASMTRRSIDVPSEYTVSSGKMSASPESIDNDSYFSETSSESPTRTLPMTEGLRTLILVSGIWVAFREGFSPNFKYDSLTLSPPQTPKVVNSHEGKGVHYGKPMNNGHIQYTRQVSEGRPQLRQSIDGRFSVPTTPTYDSFANTSSQRSNSSGYSSPATSRHPSTSSHGPFNIGLGHGERMETWQEEDEHEHRRLSIFSHNSSKRQSSSSYDRASVTKTGRFRRLFGFGRRSDHDT